MKKAAPISTVNCLGWSEDPAWQAMDMGERGMHTSLVLLAAKSGIGVVPDTAETWAACGSGTPVFAAGGALDRAWRCIDDSVLQARPDLAAWRGWRWSVLADLALGVAHAGDARMGKAAMCTGAGGDGSEDTPSEDALPRLLLETPRYERLTPAIVMGCFKASGQDERASLWEMGLAWLAQEEGSRRGSRAYLGRLIKEFGEREVFLAVADAVSRKVSPAEAKSWLRGALRRRCEGSPAEQAAREARTRVLM